jgi:hypothetical protein
MLQFLLFRFLPRRLLPLLTLYEAYRIFRRFQASQKGRPPARLVVSEPHDDERATYARDERPTA